MTRLGISYNFGLLLTNYGVVYDFHELHYNHIPSVMTEQQVYGTRVILRPRPDQRHGEAR